MLQRFNMAAMALAIAGVGGVAHAQAAGGWYVAGAVTGSDLNRPHQTIANAPGPGQTQQVVNAVNFGWGGKVAVGRSFKRLRLEGEVGYTENNSDSYTAITPLSITLPQKGTNDLTRYMANAYFDFPQGRLPVRLYLGGGLGAAHAHITTFAATARAPNAPPSFLINQKDNGFAYQLMAGFSLPLSDRLALTAQYRWFDAGTLKGVDSRGEAITREIAGHNYDVGIRISF